ncbi:hypothetical protein GOP47_0006039 [Adiantum capillus-veneris]|uniref:Large ribosomal subunit protein mL53 n=1 Tax=Adiantum capillus-veneris TaxID=13818 RepID=A0A9D4ZJY3_ADICA|nr:hypothetical protein GOP47_0006039 [Adiantum capillus-veneris]
MLKQLTKVKIEFNAFDARSASAVEFLAQCNSKKAKSSNPKCQILVKRRTDETPPLVSVTYTNGKEESLDGSVLSAQEIRKSILKKSQAIETEEMFKEAGIPWPVIIPLEEVELAKNTPFRYLSCIITVAYIVDLRNFNITTLGGNILDFIFLLELSIHEWPQQL